MISNVKEVMFLALVPVLQWKSQLHFWVYVRSKWKVSENIFNLQEWNQNAQLQIFLFNQVLLWEKNTINLSRTTTFT